MPLSNAGSKKIRSYDPVYPRMLIGALTAYRRGDFTARLPGDLGGVDGEIAEAKGDLTQTMDLEPDGQRRKGAFLNTAKTVNAMVERPGSFASEVTRVSRKAHRGQARRPGQGGRGLGHQRMLSQIGSKSRQVVRGGNG